MSKGRTRRKRYTQSQRTTILAAAQKGGLTAAQVQRKFGVTPVTYYSWRKKLGATGRSVRGYRVPIGNPSNLTSQVRTEVRSRVRQILPDIVRGEVSNYLNTLFASNRGRRRQRV